MSMCKTATLDELGRILIPREIRETLHLEEGEGLDLFVNDDGSITLIKAEEED